MTALSVVVPTHCHWSTLPYAVHSALDQSIADLEVLVVGDGVGDETRAAVADLLRDPRVRFFDNPKGARHGELHRHQALQAVRGDVVCYLSDDDLWLPNHAEQMLGLLANADFAAGCAIRIDPDDRLRVKAVDLTGLTQQGNLSTYRSGLSLSQTGHTVAAYRQLPCGWQTTPEGQSVIGYLCTEFFAQPWCRAASTWMPTVLHLGSSARPGWTPERRGAELGVWAERIRTPGFPHALLALLAEVTAASFARVKQQSAKLAALRERLDEAAQAISTLEARNADLQRRLDTQPGADADATG